MTTKGIGDGHNGQDGHLLSFKLLDDHKCQNDDNDDDDDDDDNHGDNHNDDHDDHKNLLCSTPPSSCFTRSTMPVALAATSATRPFRKWVLEP